MFLRQWLSQLVLVQKQESNAWYLRYSKVSVRFLFTFYTTHRHTLEVAGGVLRGH